jgi:predicted regulator of Ras-like GTPase activity (Roadblock/LC7/MglB family)
MGYLNVYSSEYPRNTKRSGKMDGDLYSFALKNTLDEIRNVCPDVTSAFVFREDGEITAADENTPQQNIVRIVDDFEGLLEKAEAMGGIEQITIEGSKGGVNILHVNDHYFVTITSENADKNYASMISRVLFTTVLKLLDKINHASPKDTPTETVTGPEPLVKEEEQPEQPQKPEAPNAEPKANQFMVEDIQGLLVKADTVRVDEETLLQWQELYDYRRIEEVEIETFRGQSTRCKIKPIKDSRQERKGIVQMPNRIQQLLDTKKGELVKVKPVVE